jgi:hypothetical protein
MTLSFALHSQTSLSCLFWPENGPTYFPNDQSYFSTVVVVVECSYFDGMKGVVLKATTLDFRVEFRVERKARVSLPEKNENKLERKVKEFAIC